MNYNETILRLYSTALNDLPIPVINDCHFSKSKLLIITIEQNKGNV